MSIYYKKSPCNNCPYRKDAPVRHWNRIEFVRLLENTNNVQWGSVYGCHKNDGHVCVGWLMKQDEQRFPNINLRLELIKHNVDRTYLDALHCNSDLYESVEEMIEHNYPELL